GNGRKEAALPGMAVGPELVHRRDRQCDAPVDQQRRMLLGRIREMRVERGVKLLDQLRRDRLRVLLLPAEPCRKILLAHDAGPATILPSCSLPISAPDMPRYSASTKSVCSPSFGA